MPFPLHLAYHVRDLDRARALHNGVLGALERAVDSVPSGYPIKIKGAC